MLTGEFRSQVDAIWNAFWTGGITGRSPLPTAKPAACFYARRALELAVT